jgi:tRNA-specific 2-thiouridylase
MSKNGRVVVAMSGGVDSSLAAYILKEQGYEVVGITMKLWGEEDPNASRHNKQCCSVEDAFDARRVCQLLGVPHYTLNFEREFKKHVIEYFVQEYARGRTPHPCIACNDKVKFAFFLRRAQALDADFIATGHYARKTTDGQGRHHIVKAIDAAKDQTYVLYGLRQEELANVLFPMGDFYKPDIRRIARDLKLPVADKPDSQDICFIPNGDYRAFVRERAEQRPGPIVDTRGRVLGMHQGVMNFTVGQRRGLGVQAQGKPLYVIAIEPERSTVVVGSDDDLLHEGLIADNVNFISGEPLDGPRSVTAKARYKADEAPAVITAVENGRVRVDFREPQRAVTPGQAVVFYSGDDMLGGGVIHAPVSRDAGPLEPAVSAVRVG